MKIQLDLAETNIQLSPDDLKELRSELPRIHRELTARFGAVVCPEHGPAETLTALLELESFPDVAFSFKGLCCEEMNKALHTAATA